MRRPTALAAAGAAALLVVFMGVGMLATRDEPLREWTGRLASTAEDRAASIQQWAGDLSAHARTVARFPTVVSSLGGPRTSPVDFRDEAARSAHLRGILSDGIRTHGRADLWVLDRAGRVAASGRDAEASGAVREVARAAVGSGEPRFVVYDAGPSGVRVAVAASVTARGAEGALGAVVVETPAEEFLYPLLRSEPVATRTAEALLVGLDGGSPRFLSPLRKAAPSGMGPRARFDEAVTDLILSDAEGVSILDDYSGDPVLAVARRLEGLPWALVVKVDRREARANHVANLVLLSLALLGVLLGTGGIAYGLWKRHMAAAQRAVRDHEGRFRWHAERAGDFIYRYRLVPEPGFEYVNAAW